MRALYRNVLHETAHAAAQVRSVAGSSAAAARQQALHEGMRRAAMHTIGAHLDYVFYAS